MNKDETDGYAKLRLTRGRPIEEDAAAGEDEKNEEWEKVAFGLGYEGKHGWFRFRGSAGVRSAWALGVSFLVVFAFFPMAALLIAAVAILVQALGPPLIKACRRAEQAGVEQLDPFEAVAQLPEAASEDTDTANLVPTGGPLTPSGPINEDEVYDPQWRKAVEKLQSFRSSDETQKGYDYLFMGRYVDDPQTYEPDMLDSRLNSYLHVDAMFHGSVDGGTRQGKTHKSISPFVSQMFWRKGCLKRDETLKAQQRWDKDGAIIVMDCKGDHASLRNFIYEAEKSGTKYHIFYA